MIRYIDGYIFYFYVSMFTIKHPPRQRKAVFFFFPSFFQNDDGKSSKKNIQKNIKRKLKGMRMMLEREF
jgi:hypothetical protein